MRNLNEKPACMRDAVCWWLQDDMMDAPPEVELPEEMAEPMYYADDMDG